LPEARRRSFHSLAAVYFMDGTEMQDRLEGMYHLIEAGDMKAFGEYLAEASGALLDSVPASELLTVLRKIDRTVLDPISACILAEAVAHMNQAVDLATEVSEPGALARSLTALGSIESIRGNFERGLEVKLEALRIAERGGNLTEIARACISAGMSLHELRRYEESLKYYDRALQIGRLVGNIRLQGYALMDRAAAMMDIGLYEDAGPVIEEAKRLIQVLEEK